MTTTFGKICTICGKDVAALRRVRVPEGHYYCEPCYAATAPKAPPSRQMDGPAANAASTVANPYATVRSSHPSLQSPERAGIAGQTATANALPDSRWDGFSPRETAYERSPVLQLIRGAGDMIGWSPRNKSGQAALIQIASILLLAIPVLIGFGIVAMGSQAWEIIFGPDTRGGFIQIAYPIIVPWILIFALSLVGRVIQVGFSMPSLGMPPIGWRSTAIVIAVAVLAAGAASWSRVSDLGAGTIEKSEQSVKFADLDGKFGMGALGNSRQWAKTSDQFRADMESYKGAHVWWKGVVVNVRDGQVLIQMRRTSLENEVALVVGWWDQWKLPAVHRDDLIEFTGVINGFGSPYPYAVTNGSVISTHPASPDEIKAVLPGL